jgi:glycosyltransferase involved in cell wall biosynthesis
MKAKFSGYEKLFLLDAIYDQRELNKLRSNCTLYVHGHSAGGTNPSLVEAMNLGLPIFCFSSGFNEHTTENKALYFKDKDELRLLVNSIDSQKLSELGLIMKSIANRRYRWEIIANKYAFCLNEALAMLKQVEVNCA